MRNYSQFNVTEILNVEKLIKAHGIDDKETLRVVIGNSKLANPYDVTALVVREMGDVSKHLTGHERTYLIFRVLDLTSETMKQ